MQLLLHPFDRPIFRLWGSAAQCHVEIRVNDVPILRDTSGLAHDFDIAINEWLFQGINRIDFHLSACKPDSPFQPRAVFSAKLRHKTARDTVRNVTDIGELAWKPDPAPAHARIVPTTNTTGLEDPNVPLLALPGQAEDFQWICGLPAEQPDKSVLISSAIALPPPWPVCPWLRGSVLNTQAGTQRVVTGMLRTLHRTLKLGGWEELFKARRAALQTAYYLGGDEMDDALGFPLLLTQQEWQLQPLSEGPLMLELAGHGKIARLLDPATGEPPLSLLNESARLSATIDAWWMSANEWLMVR